MLRRSSTRETLRAPWKCSRRAFILLQRRRNAPDLISTCFERSAAPPAATLTTLRPLAGLARPRVSGSKFHYHRFRPCRRSCGGYGLDGSRISRPLLVPPRECGLLTRRCTFLLRAPVMQCCCIGRCAVLRRLHCFHPVAPASEPGSVVAPAGQPPPSALVQSRSIQSVSELL